MALVVADRVQETCAAPGTSTATLLGAVYQYQSFSTGIGANNTTPYVIADQAGPNWEVGIGTVGATGLTLARTTILASSNGGSIVNFSTGIQNVWCDYSAVKAIFKDASGNISNLDGSISTVKSINFNATTPTVTDVEGLMYWNDADSAKTMNIVMASGAVVQQVGEEQYYRIKASSAITNGQVIMFSGTVGASGGLYGAPATGLTAATASYIMGIATEDIALNAWGYVTSFGLVRGINTTGGAESWVDGDILYYNPSVAGGLTKTLPTAPNAKVQVAAVVHAASGSGSLFIRPSFGGILGQYEGDVGFTSIAAGNLIRRNAGNTAWENVATIPNSNLDNSSITINGSAISLGGSVSVGTVTSVTGTAPVSVATGTSTPVISMAAATGSVNGYLTSTDWTTFNSKQPAGSYLTAVTANAPLTGSGTSASHLSIPAATSLVDGYLSSTDWTTFNNKTSNTGTVTSVAASVPTGLSISGTPITSSGTLTITYTAGYAIPTTAKQTEWDSAYTDRLKWDGGATGLVAATGRTSLGATTVGGNFFTLTNPTAITFPRMNADNTVSALDAATFRTAIGAGTSSTTGTVTSVAALTLGTTGTDLSSSVATGTTTPVITLNVPTASASNRGALSAADWTTFNNKGNGTVTSVTGTSPIASSGGATPAISIAQATTSTSGYLSSTDWNTFNGKWTNGTALSATTGTFSGNVSVNSIIRTASGTGYLNGNYTTAETVSTSGCIYTIGGSYVPGTTSLGNMYGIGYGYSGNAGITATGVPVSHWGMYVASGGVSRIFLDSDTGAGYFNSTLSASNLSGTNTGDQTNISGNAATATKLSTTTTGTAPAYANRGWASFASGGTIAESANVSSISYFAVGQHGINLTTAMTTANYAYTGSTTGTAADAYAIVCEFSRNGGTTRPQTASQFTIITCTGGQNNSFRNPDRLCGMAYQ